MTRMRSPNYPAISLGDAIESVRRLYHAEKRSIVPASVAAEAIGYQGLSGPARTRLSALRKYGLVDDDRDGLRVSDRGLRLVLHEAGSREYLAAAKQAAVEPELFRDLLATHSAGSDTNLRNHLIIKLGFSDLGAKQFIKAFRETLELARLNAGDYHTDETPAAPEALEQDSEGGPPERSSLGRVIDLIENRANEGVKVYSWPLSKGVTAEVRLTGAEIKPQHLKMLQQYLSLAQEAWDIDADEEPPGGASPLQPLQSNDEAPE